MDIRSLAYSSPRLLGLARLGFRVGGFTWGNKLVLSVALLVTPSKSLQNLETPSLRRPFLTGGQQGSKEYSSYILYNSNTDTYILYNSNANTYILYNSDTNNTSIFTSSLLTPVSCLHAALREDLSNPSTLNPKLQTLNPKTLNPKP